MLFFRFSTIVQCSKYLYMYKCSMVRIAYRIRYFCKGIGKCAIYRRILTAKYNTKIQWYLWIFYLQFGGLSFIHSHNTQLPTNRLTFISVLFFFYLTGWVFLLVLLLLLFVFWNAGARENEILTFTLIFPLPLTLTLIFNRQTDASAMPNNNNNKKINIKKFS